MKRSLILISLALLWIITASAVHADVIDPGEKNVPLYYKITNIDSYPDYVFLLQGNPTPSFMVLNSSEFSFYKLSTGSIYAVGKTSFNQSELEKMNATQLDNYFNNNTNVIHSNTELKGSYGNVNQSSSLNKVVVELEITSINDTDLVIKKTRAIYFYADGSNKTAQFQDQNTTPTPDNSLNPADILWYFILPLIAVVAVLLIIFRRKINS